MFDNFTFQTLKIGFVNSQSLLIYFLFLNYFYFAK